jgi:hypothetical protein
MKVHATVQCSLVAFSPTAASPMKIVLKVLKLSSFPQKLKLYTCRVFSSLLTNIAYYFPSKELRGKNLETK